MNNLHAPLPDIAPEAIFEECVAGYRDALKRQKLMNYKCRVKNDSENYFQMISESSNPPTPPSIPVDDGKKLARLYDQKFVQGPGRKYYDRIISQAPFGICPICGISEATTLDHYLPKSKYPTLSVTPANLIPACRDCNTKKGSDSTLPVHLYFDSVPDGEWLHVKLDDDMAPCFFVSCPEDWDRKLKERIKTHFAIFKLGTLYSAHAAQEIAGKARCWRLAVEQSVIALEDSIKYELLGYESIDRNSWKSALYRALRDNTETIISFLERTGTRNASFEKNMRATTIKDKSNNSI